MIRMGRSSKNEEAETPATPQRTPEPSYSYEKDYGNNQAMSESETMAKDIKDGRLNGFVGHGTVLTGETYFNSMLRVDGQLTGKVSSEDGTLIVGSTGVVEADVTVAGAVINGTVNGDVIVSEKLELGRTARVIGNIRAPRLIVEDGAILEGSCAMIRSNEEIAEAEAEAEAIAAAESEVSVAEEVSYQASTEETTSEDSSEYSTSSYEYEEDDDEETAEAAVT